MQEQSDERINKMNETLQGIKLIKLLAWEKLHENRIQTTREIELKYLNNESIYWALMSLYFNTIISRNYFNLNNEILYFQHF